MSIKKDSKFRISKKAFYKNGGFSNSQQYRTQKKSGWAYWAIK